MVKTFIEMNANPYITFHHLPSEPNSLPAGTIRFGGIIYIIQRDIIIHGNKVSVIWLQI